MIFSNSFKGLPRILIIDDSQESIDIVKARLPKGMFHIDVSYGQEEALEFLSHLKTPDLILLDMNLGKNENQGIEFCKKLKGSLEIGDIPIIFLTADTDPEVIINAYRSGGSDYIVKPFSKDELYTRVTTQIDLFRRKTADRTRKEIKKNLLHLLTHELINPILGAKTIFQNILEDPKKLSENGTFVLETLEDSLKMIEESRNLLNQDEDIGSFSNSFFSLNVALEDARSFLIPKLTKKNITIDILCEKNLEVYGDQDIFINSIFAPILQNAINFSKRDDKITIKSNYNDSSIKLEIIDQGIGIPNPMLKDIFNVSKMTKRKGTEGEPTGMGLSLAEVKNCLSLFESEIEISSKEIKPGNIHHGTVVTLYLSGRIKELAA